jgi:hypothetical protein
VVSKAAIEKRLARASARALYPRGKVCHKVKAIYIYIMCASLHQLYYVIIYDLSLRIT